MQEAMPVGAGPSSSAGPPSPVIRSAPERFLETWLDAMGGFLFCVVLPIPIYATGEPFAGSFAGTEFTILATAGGYTVVWYCGRRLAAHGARLCNRRQTLRTDGKIEDHRGQRAQAWLSHVARI